ncbi:hypothetical protein [Enterobacter asburiae]|uniref:hypothetical protein n=1 Tax=Enterobacter asburiae TaxID=61645 RepID=UPI0011D19E14|nr:hypothetical protein [Enterobacter asburiae]
MQELFKDVTVSIIVSWWGAFVATVLAIIKVMETLRDRTRIDVGASFTTSVNVGHEIRIRNLSPRPVVLTHWEIYYASKCWHKLGRKDIETREFDTSDTTLSPFTTHALGFNDKSYFSITHKKMQSKAIYIEICFAGRRRIRRKIYV